MSQSNKYPQLNTPIQYQYYPNYLEKLSSVLMQQLRHNNRVTCMRVDLRLPKAWHYQDHNVISRFIDAMKSRLNSWGNKRCRSGSIHHPIGFSYLWVRERNEAHHWHYHFVLFFNKDAFAHMGALDLNRYNMYSRIVGAWASALDMHDIEAKALVHIPQRPVYYLDQNSSDFQIQVNRFWQRFTYLAKSNTKVIGDGHRNIGFSCKVFNGSSS